MSSTPPPWQNITGITRAVMKDNAQTPLSNYDGNARPGEIVVNQSDYSMWIGNTQGVLNQAPIFNAATGVPPSAYLGAFYFNIDQGQLSGEGLYFCANLNLGWQKVSLT
jgi:hypothetical protein